MSICIYIYISYIYISFIYIYIYIHMSQHPQSCFCKALEAANRSAYAFLGFMNDSQLPDEIAMTGKMNGHDFDLQLDCRGP